jgi:hypothetical protein
VTPVLAFDGVCWLRVTSGSTSLGAGVLRLLVPVEGLVLVGVVVDVGLLLVPVEGLVLVGVVVDVGLLLVPVEGLVLVGVVGRRRAAGSGSVRQVVLHRPKQGCLVVRSVGRRV